MQQTDATASSSTEFLISRSQDAAIPSPIDAKIEQNQFGHFTEHMTESQISGARMIGIQFCQA